MVHEHIGFVATTIILRQGLWTHVEPNDQSIISDEVNIELDIELVEQPTQQSDHKPAELELAANR